jgi:hypothetical protein
VRLEEWVAILVGLAALGIDLALIRVGLDPQDEGYFMEQATRVLRGDLPYRDFDTLYTPGLLYLHAALLGLVGDPSVLVLRAVGFVARALLAFGLYALCRRLARPLFAILPALYVLVGLDGVPQTWEPHPGWPSAALTVLTVLAVTRLPALRGRQRGLWLFGIGAATAVVFVFKQNVGVFLGMAVVACAVLQGLDGARQTPTRGLRLLQLGLIAAFLLAVAWLIHSHADVLVAVYFLVPIGAALVAPLWLPDASDSGRGPSSLLAPFVWLAAGFGIVTLPWLVALLGALDGQVALLSGFVGAVDQDVLWHPLDLPTGGDWATVLGCVVAVVLALQLGRSMLGRLAASGVAVTFAACGVLLTAHADDNPLAAVLLWPGRATDNTQALLPLLAIVAGAVWCVRAPRSNTRWEIGWLTMASAVIFLSEYPRIDEVHLAWAASLAFATGAVVLEKLYAWLVRRWRLEGAARGVLVAALLAVPAATTVPNIGERIHALAVSEKNTAAFTSTMNYVQGVTSPGEPIFVYPTMPLLYVMADRPNPTRYAHLYPGAASPNELDSIIATLDEQPVRVVVVNQAALKYWGPPASNQPLEDFLALGYQSVARFGDYRVLVRR